MNPFYVSFTGDTLYKQSDMAAIARGAGGVVYGDVTRAVADASKSKARGREVEVLLVQGAWVTGRAPSRKTKDASKPGSNVTILKDTEFLERDDIKLSKRRLDEAVSVKTHALPSPRPHTVTPCSRAVPTKCLRRARAPAPQRGDNEEVPDHDDLDDFQVKQPQKKPKEPEEPKTGGSVQSTNIETEEVLYGIEPEFKLPSSTTPEDLEKIIKNKITENFMPLKEAPDQVRRDIGDVDIPFDQIITTFVLILTDNSEMNAAILSTGLHAFVEIARDLGWMHVYVGASMRTLSMDNVILDRSITTKGTMTRRGKPSPPTRPTTLNVLLCPHLPQAHTRRLRTTRAATCSSCCGCLQR